MMGNRNTRTIEFHFLITPFKFVKRSELKNSITELFKLEAKDFNSLNYIFCSDSYLLELNRTFLHHNYFTDILTFNLSETNNIICGDIFISVDRVKENAGLVKATFANELRRVIFHGALHLCGYKDKTKKDQSIMRTKEDLYLNLFK